MGAFCGSISAMTAEINRQGPDVGTQYRSAIFPANQGQARAAEAYIAQLNQARVFPAGIATRIEPGREFHPAEAYHQDYLTRNPTNRYIAVNDLPKIEDLLLFPEALSRCPGARRGLTTVELTNDIKGATLGHRLIMAQPEVNGSQLEHGEEVCGVFFVARGERWKCLIRLKNRSR